MEGWGDVADYIGTLNVESQGWTPPKWKDLFTSMMEQNFQNWNTERSTRLGLNPNPDDPRHFYDLRGAFLRGLSSDPETGHLSDLYKLPGHPSFSDESVYYQPGMKALKLKR
jgi:hypothetical protein